MTSSPEIVFSEGHDVVHPWISSMTPPPNNGPLKGTASLLNSEKYSDLIIVTRTRSFKAHKAVVCTQSQVFAAMSDGYFKESSTSNLGLEDDDPATVERMIAFLYTGKYDQGNSDIPAKEAKRTARTTLMVDTLVYSLADKYDIKGLKVLARFNFRRVDCCTAWQCEDFLNIVRAVLNTTPDNDSGLRDMVSCICARHIDEVLADETWNDFLADNGALGLSIFKVARQYSIAEAQDLKGDLRNLRIEHRCLTRCSY